MAQVFVFCNTFPFRSFVLGNYYLSAITASFDAANVVFVYIHVHVHDEGQKPEIAVQCLQLLSFGT